MTLKPDLVLEILIFDLFYSKPTVARLLKMFAVPDNSTDPLNQCLSPILVQSVAMRSTE